MKNSYSEVCSHNPVSFYKTVNFKTMIIIVDLHCPKYTNKLLNGLGIFSICYISVQFIKFKTR